LLPACGQIVVPIPPEAGDAASVDVTEASADVTYDVDANAVDTRNADGDADAATNVDGPAIPLARVIAVETSAPRPSVFESLTAVALNTSAGGSYSRLPSGRCVVENIVHPIYAPFADQLQITAGGREFQATRQRDQSLRWQSSEGDVFAPSVVATALATRSDWPSNWRFAISYPAPIQVLSPPATVLFISRGDTIDVRWTSIGVPADAFVEVRFERFLYDSARPGVEDVSAIRCEFEPWRERATLTPSEHTAFRHSSIPRDNLLFSIDTVRRTVDRLPNGEPVLVEARSNSYSIVVAYDR
jgi:hypothetical protein